MWFLFWNCCCIFECIHHIRYPFDKCYLIKRNKAKHSRIHSFTRSIPCNNTKKTCTPKMKHLLIKFDSSGHLENKKYSSCRFSNSFSFLSFSRENGIENLYFHFTFDMWNFGKWCLNFNWIGDLLDFFYKKKTNKLINVTFEI